MGSIAGLGVSVEGALELGLTTLGADGDIAEEGRSWLALQPADVHSTSKLRAKGVIGKNRLFMVTVYVLDAYIVLGITS